MPMQAAESPFGAAQAPQGTQGVTEDQDARVADTNVAHQEAGNLFLPSTVIPVCTAWGTCPLFVDEDHRGYCWD
jgi:hypothetical protein